MEHHTHSVSRAGAELFLSLPNLDPDCPPNLLTLAQDRLTVSERARERPQTPAVLDPAPPSPRVGPDFADLCGSSADLIASDRDIRLTRGWDAELVEERWSMETGPPASEPPPLPLTEKGNQGLLWLPLNPLLATLSM